MFLWISDWMYILCWCGYVGTIIWKVSWFLNRRPNPISYLIFKNFLPFTENAPTSPSPSQLYTFNIFSQQNVSLLMNTVFITWKVHIMDFTGSLGCFVWNSKFWLNRIWNYNFSGVRNLMLMLTSSLASTSSDRSLNASSTPLPLGWFWGDLKIQSSVQLL